MGDEKCSNSDGESFKGNFLVYHFVITYSIYPNGCLNKTAYELNL